MRLYNCDNRYQKMINLFPPIYHACQICRPLHMQGQRQETWYLSWWGTYSFHSVRGILLHLTSRNEYIFYLVCLADYSTLPAQRTALCGSFRWWFWLKKGLPLEKWLMPAVLALGMMEQQQPSFGALATEKCNLLLLFRVFLFSGVIFVISKY